MHQPFVGHAQGNEFMIKKYIIIIFSLSILTISYNKADDKRKGKIELQNSEIEDLLDRLEPIEDSILNIHLSYDEYLNDSCVVMTIVQNHFEPEDSQRLLNKIKFKGIDVFVHKTHEDRAFFVPDSYLGVVVLQRTNGTNRFYKMEILSKMFKAGIPHKFWNAGNELLCSRGYISPAGNAVYFLSQLFKSAKENGGRPGIYDAAFLLDRYKSEFGMLEIPQFVQKTIFPMVLFLGYIIGKNKKFIDAPPPL